MEKNNHYQAIKNGFILGFCFILLTSYIYFANLKLLTNVWFGVVNIVISILIGIVSIVQFKNAARGLITFKEAFTVYFKTLIIGSFLNCLYLIVLFTFVFTPEKIELIKDLLTNFNLYIMKLNYASSEDLAKAKSYSEQMNPDDVGAIITSAVKYLLRDCLIGLLVALIFRNKRSL